MGRLAFALPLPICWASAQPLCASVARCPSCLSARLRRVGGEDKVTVNSRVLTPGLVPESTGCKAVYTDQNTPLPSLGPFHLPWGFASRSYEELAWTSLQFGDWLGCGAHTGRPEVTSTLGGCCEFPRSGDPRSRCGQNSALLDASQGQPAGWWEEQGWAQSPPTHLREACPVSAQAERLSDPEPCGSQTFSNRKQHTAFISSRRQITWGTSVVNRLDFFQTYIYYHHNQDMKLPSPPKVPSGSFVVHPDGSAPDPDNHQRGGSP